MVFDTVQPHLEAYYYGVETSTGVRFVHTDARDFEFRTPEEGRIFFQILALSSILHTSIKFYG